MSEASSRSFGDLAEVVTVGLPFCVFKGLVGALLFGDGHRFGGAALLALAVVDAVFNLVNLVALVTVRRRVGSSCALSAVVTRLRLFAGRPSEDVRDLGDALDTLLSFTLVAAMVGFGRIGSLPAGTLPFWNAAVVLNVLGAGLSRVSASVRRLPRGV
jgi:hypothetical protein